MIDGTPGGSYQEEEAEALVQRFDVLDMMLLAIVRCYLGSLCSVFLHSMYVCNSW